MAKFEDNLVALETVVERLERGDLPLDDAVKLFEDGVRLSTACKAELGIAEGRVQILLEQGKGQMDVADLDVKVDEYDEEDDE